MSTEIQKIDYAFNLGKYKDLEKKKDKNNVLYKLNALLNIIHMKPGTLQDTPFCGIDMTGILYTEGNDMYTARNKIQYDILAQSSKYIEQDFVGSINITATKIEGSNDGSQAVSMEINLKNNIGLLVESTATPKGLIFKRAILDETPFVSSDS